MGSLEAQIAEWRRYLGDGPAVDIGDVEELEAHLRDQIDALRLTGLSDEEAFLIAVRRLGHLDDVWHDVVTYERRSQKTGGPNLPTRSCEASYTNPPMN